MPLSQLQTQAPNSDDENEDVVVGSVGRHISITCPITQQRLVEPVKK